MNLVLHNIFYHYTILFKWITGFTDLSHPFQFLSFPKFSSSSPSRYNLEDGPSTKPCIWSSLSKYLCLIFSVDRRGTCRPFHSRVSNVSNWYSPLMSTTLKLQTDVTSSIYPSFLNFFASMPSISPSTFFASTVDKMFQKKFQFSWRHTSSCLINIHDYAN